MRSNIIQILYDYNQNINGHKIKVNK